MIIVYIVFFGWMGNRLFRGTIEGAAECSGIGSCSWHLLVLMTTANFPDVMLPAYGLNQGYVLFFFIYMIFGLFFLMNLVLAIFYTNYSNRIQETIDKFEDTKVDYLKQ